MERVQTGLRLPVELRDKLQNIADARSLSLNQAIVETLEHALQLDDIAVIVEVAVAQAFAAERQRGSGWDGK